MRACVRSCLCVLVSLCLCVVVFSLGVNILETRNNVEVEIEVAFACFSAEFFDFFFMETSRRRRSAHPVLLCRKIHSACSVRP